MIEPIFYTHIFDQQLYKINDKNLPEKIDINSVIKVDEITKLLDKPAPTLEMDRSTKELSDKCSKNIWLLVQPENNENITALELDMIVKTLGALKLLMEDVAIFVAEEVRHTYFETINLKGKKIVDFGMSHENLTKDKLKVNELVKIRDGNYLFTATLKQLQNNIDLKKAWWGKMKLLFD